MKRPILDRLQAKAREEGRIVVDHLVLVCKQCRTERTVYPDVPLYGAAELVAYMKTKLTPCTCGATTCDVNAHISNPEVLKDE